MLFNQRIGLIEATEELKRVNVDTKTFTRPKTHLYSETGYSISPVGDPGSEAGEELSLQYFATWTASSNGSTSPVTTNLKNTAYKNIYAYGGTLGVKSLCFWQIVPGINGAPSTWFSTSTTVTIKSPSGAIETLANNILSNTGVVFTNYELKEEGEYTLTYSGKVGNPDYPEGAITYTIISVRDIVLRKDKSITEVINTVLNYACGNRNRYYVLDPTYAEKWQNIVAPEFYFTRNTLYEVLLQIGGYRDIQAIPRLEWYDGIHLTANDEVGTGGGLGDGSSISAVAIYSSTQGYTGTVKVKDCRFWTGAVTAPVWLNTAITVSREKNGETEQLYAVTKTGAPSGTVYSAPYDGGKIIVEYKYDALIPSNDRTVEYTFENAGLRLITFDDLNDESEWTPPGAETTDPYGNLITYHEEQSADDYFAGLDSYADNIIDNSVNGSIGLPSPYTPRCESGDLAVTDNTVIIETSMPIYSVQKVELFYKDNLIVPIKDITPYIFEKSEYDLLTDYQGEFPTAKQYAFYYSQGARNIYGLTLKPEVFDFLGISQEAQETAAVKVYEAVSGKEFDSATQKVIDFMYRVTYTPIQTRRLKQYRPLVGERPDWDISYYNQSANTLDAKNFGDNMKFMLLQKGNRLKVVTYRLTGDTGSILEQMPKIGQTLNGAKICQVDAEYERYSVKVTLWLTEHYNRKSQYVEINAQKRFYEISERQSVLRQLNASYEYRIGKIDPNADKAIISADLVESFIKGTTPTNTDNRVAQAVVKMYTDDDGNGEQIGDALLLPVAAMGFGNSISLHFEMKDNYSAGDQVIYKDPNNINSVSLLRAVPYGDEYGEFISMTIGFLGGEIPWSALSNEGWSSYRRAGRALPEMDASLDDDETPLFADVLNVAKDNREQISVDVQIHFRTDNSAIVIGSAFGERFPYVNAHIGTDDEELAWVYLPDEIAPLQNRVSTSGTIFTPTTSTSEDGVKVTASESGNAKAWALIVKNTGELLVGINGNFGQAINFPTKVKPL